MYLILVTYDEDPYYVYVRDKIKEILKGHSRVLSPEKLKDIGRHNENKNAQVESMFRI